MLQPPTMDMLRDLSKEYRLNANDEELKVFAESIKHDLETLKSLDEWENPFTLEKLKHNDRIAQRASPGENPYNAWYQKCTIQGQQGSPKLLHGYKIAIKDNISIANVPMMNGSKLMEGYVSEFDASVVTRILDHGGVIIGTTTCESLCLSGASYNTNYGPVRNPWNPAYSAGGSSSGSGVVVASGAADMALGCDQGGSIRIPASNCGIVGLKPTFGLVPYTGIMSIDTTLDHVGPMARNVTDCARLLSAIGGFDDGKDFRQPSCGFHTPDYLAQVGSAKSGTLRIGILKEGFHECDETVLKCINHAIDMIKYSKKFSEMDEVSIPDHDKALTAYLPVVFTGFQNQVVNGYGYGTGCAGVLAPSICEKLYEGFKNHSHTLTGLVKASILSTAYVEKVNPVKLYSSYAKGQTIGWTLKKQYDKYLTLYDVLIMPTLPKLPAKIPGENTSLAEIFEGSANMIKNTAPFDLTHHPALTINAGYDEATGLPIGLQLVGRLWGDATVLQAGKIMEDILAPLQKPFPS